MQQFPSQLRQLFDEVPREHWHWTPASWEGIPSEALDPVGQLCHVRDIEQLGYHVRFRRLLEEREPVLASLDTEALAVQQRYAEADPAQALTAFARAREHTMALLQGLSTAQLQRRGSFDGYGEVTVQSLIHFLSSHDQQHLAGMQWLLGRIASLGGSAH
nr:MULTISPECIES: DinB family protein [Myxococcaceae]